MRLFPASPRRRRRLAWLGALGAAAGAVALLIVLFPSPDKVEETAPLEPGGWVPAPQEQVEPSQDATAHALAVAADFVRTAVARRNVGSSWELVTPRFRLGFTRKAWAKGDIPVVPFPVDIARWRLEYSLRNELGFEVALFPPKQSDQRATVFDIGMLAVGSGSDRHWLVDYFSPGPVGSAPSPGTLRPEQPAGPRHTVHGQRVEAVQHLADPAVRRARAGAARSALLRDRALVPGIPGQARLRRRHRPPLGAGPRRRARGRRRRARGRRRAGARRVGA